MRTYISEFSGFDLPIRIQALVMAGKLEDTSWGNDVCPSFEAYHPGEAIGVRLWVDYPYPEDRELGGKRFRIQEVCRTDHSPEDEFVLETDEENEAVAWLMRFLTEPAAL